MSVTSDSGQARNPVFRGLRRYFRSSGIWIVVGACIGDVLINHTIDWSLEILPALIVLASLWTRVSELEDRVSRQEDALKFIVDEIEAQPGLDEFRAEMTGIMEKLREYDAVKLYNAKPAGSS